MVVAWHIPRTAATRCRASTRGATTWLAACAAPPQQPLVTTPLTYQGAGVGALVGAAGAGALIDSKNRWRGAVLAENRPVSYQSTDGWQRLETQPQGSRGPNGCPQVPERVYQNGQLVREQLREVC